MEIENFMADYHSCPHYSERPVEYLPDCEQLVCPSGSDPCSATGSFLEQHEEHSWMNVSEHEEEEINGFLNSNFVKALPEKWGSCRRSEECNVKSTASHANKSSHKLKNRGRSAGSQSNQSSLFRRKTVDRAIRRLEAQQGDREAKVQAVLDSALDWLLFPFESSSSDCTDNEYSGGCDQDSEGETRSAYHQSVSEGGSDSFKMSSQSDMTEGLLCTNSSVEGAERKAEIGEEALLSLKRKRGRPKGSVKKKNIARRDPGLPGLQECKNSNDGSLITDKQTFKTQPSEWCVKDEGMEQSEDIALSGISQCQIASDSGVTSRQNLLARTGSSRPKKKTHDLFGESLVSNQGSDSDYEPETLEVKSEDKMFKDVDAFALSPCRRACISARPRGRPMKHKAASEEVLLQNTETIDFGLAGSEVELLILQSSSEFADCQLNKNMAQAKRKRGRPRKYPKVDDNEGMDAAAKEIVSSRQSSVTSRSSSASDACVEDTVLPVNS